MEAHPSIPLAQESHKSNPTSRGKKVHSTHSEVKVHQMTETNISGSRVYTPPMEMNWEREYFFNNDIIHHTYQTVMLTVRSEAHPRMEVVHLGASSNRSRQHKCVM